MEENIENKRPEPEKILSPSGDFIDRDKYVSVSRSGKESGRCIIPLTNGESAIVIFLPSGEPLLHNKRLFNPNEAKEIIIYAQENFQKAPTIKKEITPSSPKKKQAKPDNKISPRPKSKKTITPEEFIKQLERIDPDGYKL